MNDSSPGIVYCAELNNSSFSSLVGSGYSSTFGDAKGRCNGGSSSVGSPFAGFGDAYGMFKRLVVPTHR